MFAVPRKTGCYHCRAMIPDKMQKYLSYYAYFSGILQTKLLIEMSCLRFITSYELFLIRSSKCIVIIPYNFYLWKKKINIYIDMTSTQIYLIGTTFWLRIYFILSYVFKILQHLMAPRFALLVVLVACSICIRDYEFDAKLLFDKEVSTLDLKYLSYSWVKFYRRKYRTVTNQRGY